MGIERTIKKSYLEIEETLQKSGHPFIFTFADFK